MRNYDPSTRLGLVLGVLAALRLLATEYGDPRFETSITFRQVFYWSTGPLLLVGMPLLGSMVGWFVGRWYARGGSSGRDAETSVGRGCLAIVSGYFACVWFVNNSERALRLLSSRWDWSTSGITPPSRLVVMLHLGIVFAGLLAGGYIAAWVGSRQDTRDACLLGVFTAFIGAYELLGTEPQWVAVITIMLPLPSALAGGYLRVHGRFVVRRE